MYAEQTLESLRRTDTLIFQVSIQLFHSQKVQPKCRVLSCPLACIRLRCPSIKRDPLRFKP